MKCEVGTCEVKQAGSVRSVKCAVGRCVKREVGNVKRSGKREVGQVGSVKREM